VTENTYLNRQEQMIFNAISSADIVNSNEIKDIFPGLKPYQVNKVCSSLSSKGYLHRLKKGVYLIQEKPSNIPVIKNAYKIALAMFKGYIGFSSALRLYDLIDYEPFTIFVVTRNRSMEKIIGEYTLKYVAMGDKATGMTYYNGVYVSTTAKTFFDCFYKPQYGGGYSTITKALYDADIDWNEFLGYFGLASSSLCQRTGYVLDLLGDATSVVPNDVLDNFKNRIKNNTRLLPSGSSKGKYIKEWMVLDNLGKENILSWWYHG
jgi:predicted transcriptional regulator of viral defense system